MMAASKMSLKAETKGSDYVEKKQRFHFKIIEELNKLTVTKPPKITNNHTKWVVKNFESWRNQENLTFPDTPVPDNLLTSGSPE